MTFQWTTGQAQAIEEKLQYVMRKGKERRKWSKKEMRIEIF